MVTARAGVSVMALMAEMTIGRGNRQGELAKELAGDAAAEMRSAGTRNTTPA